MIIYIDLCCLSIEEHFSLKKDKIQDTRWDDNPEGRLQDLFKQRTGILDFIKYFYKLWFHVHSGNNFHQEDGENFKNWGNVGNSELHFLSMVHIWKMFTRNETFFHISVSIRYWDIKSCLSLKAGKEKEHNTMWTSDTCECSSSNSSYCVYVSMIKQPSIKFCFTFSCLWMSGRVINKILFKEVYK